MSRPVLHLDAGARTDRVTFAIAPVDPVSGALVTSGVAARVDGLVDRAVRNASGLLVFVNLPDQPEYRVEVDARTAGYFGPVTVVVQPPAARVELLLEPQPNFAFPAGTTLVRGQIVRGSAPVAGAAIEARPQGSAGGYRTRSAASGAFALAVRLPAADDFAGRRPVATEIRFSGGGLSRLVVRDLVGGRSHSFLEAIDLEGANDPQFFTV